MPLGIEMLRRLAEFKVSDGPVLSLYVDLDPSQFPNEASRTSEIESLLGEAGKRYLDGLDRDGAEALRTDIERIRSYFENDFSPKGVRAVAVFSSVTADLFETVSLSQSVERAVVVDDSPYIEPLAGVMPSTDWCVCLVNRRVARVMRGSRGEITERASVVDDVPGQHDQGGYSQARFERHIEKVVEDHVKHVCGVLFDMHKASPFDRLLIGCTDELMPEVEQQLHDYLRQRLAGRFDVDVENTSWVDVLEAARPLMERDERDRERELLDRLSEGLGRQDGAVAGLTDSLNALYERRAGALLLKPGLHQSGVVCPTCGWAGPEADKCPIDGTATNPREDVVETAVELALGQSADVIALQHHPEELDEHGGVAVLLRF